MAEQETEQEPSIEEILSSIRQIISDDDEDGADEAQESAGAGDIETPAEEEARESDLDLSGNDEAEAMPDFGENAASEEATPSFDADEAPAEEPAVDFAADEPEEDVLELTDIVEDEESSSNDDSNKEYDVDMQDAADEEQATSLDEILAEDNVEEPVDNPMDDFEPDIAAEAEPAIETPQPAPAAPSIVEQEAENFESILTEKAKSAAVGGFTELVKKTAIERGGITLEEIVRSELNPMLRDWLDKNLPSIIERLVQEELDRIAKRALEE
ncbi:MAG: hypothetical protein CMH26_02125 [Micavibrio sp.]|nr:hypothetical protein [Micavibrio sp.]|tara:strand:+ start:320 stop:1132 length:813 start_codon:yes stop_codon:yes gene_type:complete